MNNFILLKILVNQVWSPPEGFFFVLLVLGALLTAAVALLIFTFYEDYYWTDKEYRDQLRFPSMRHKNKA